MNNLKTLFVKFTDERTSTYLFVLNNNGNFFNTKTINKDEAVQWLKDHLPATCFIQREPALDSSIQIWIR
jgi:hypothetical protein